MQRTILYRISWIINKCIICFIRKYNPVSPTCLLYKLYKIFFLHKRTTNLRHIISVSGFHYSGSSAVIGLLSEYSNIDILGDSDTIYSKSIRHKYLSEVVFFSGSNLFKLINAFKQGSPLDKDVAIKQFICDIYHCYDNKGLVFYEYNPSFYSYNFLVKSIDFLFKIIDLDDTTRNILQKYRFPYVFNSNTTQFKNCSFMKSNNIHQFILYQFKDISTKEFDTYVEEYLHNILHSVGKKEFFICDQLLPSTKGFLETFRYYEKSALQICVYRDPRDQFLSAFRWGLNYLPRDIDGFVTFYHKEHLQELFAEASPYRLMVRFEDLVLNYDETVRRIMDFCGLDPADHMAPKAVFDPAASAVNIGAYKQFVDQEFMRQIEERLGEYCYYPEKENLSEAAWELLRKTRSL